VNYKAALGGLGDVPIVINGQTFYTNNYMKEGFAYPDEAKP
jgi:hypothetical protein